MGHSSGHGTTPDGKAGAPSWEKWLPAPADPTRVPSLQRLGKLWQGSGFLTNSEAKPSTGNLGAAGPQFSALTEEPRV